MQGISHKQNKSYHVPPSQQPNIESLITGGVKKGRRNRSTERNSVLKQAAAYGSNKVVKSMKGEKKTTVALTNLKWVKEFPLKIKKDKLVNATLSQQPTIDQRGTKRSTSKRTNS
jgi:hypothetical protein